MNELRGPFAINHGVVAKVIDGELIVIRLLDGTYYSMDNAGARIWELIERRADITTIVERISTAYGTPADQVATDTAAVVRDLLAEQLIVADEGEPQRLPDDVSRVSVAYDTPSLHIYRDMGNLLALDPPTPGIDDFPLKNERP